MLTGGMDIQPGPTTAEEPAALAPAPWWRRGLRNGVLMGLLALAAILLLAQGELPGLGRVLADLPSGVAISVAVHLPQILLTAMGWRVLLPRGQRPGHGRWRCSAGFGNSPMRCCRPARGWARRRRGCWRGAASCRRWPGRRGGPLRHCEILTELCRTRRFAAVSLASRRRPGHT